MLVLMASAPRVRKMQVLHAALEFLQRMWSVRSDAHEHSRPGTLLAHLFLHLTKGDALWRKSQCRLLPISRIPSSRCPLRTLEKRATRSPLSEALQAKPFPES